MREKRRGAKEESGRKKWSGTNKVGASKDREKSKKKASLSWHLTNALSWHLTKKEKCGII